MRLPDQQFDILGTWVSPRSLGSWIQCPQVSYAHTFSVFYIPSPLSSSLSSFLTLELFLSLVPWTHPSSPRLPSKASSLLCTSGTPDIPYSKSLELSQKPLTSSGFCFLPGKHPKARTGKGPVSPLMLRKLQTIAKSVPPPAVFIEFHAFLLTRLDTAVE